MRKFGLICLTVCLLVAFALNVTAASDVNNTVINGAHSLDGAIPLLGSDRLVSNVQSAIVYETKSQTLMHGFNIDEKISPASLVKILTALMVVERADLSDAVTVTEDVLNTVSADAVSAELVAGEVLTVQDLMYCMMVGSANDAAAVLANHVSGSQNAFVSEMNQYAADLGCTQTNFTNVHGLHDEAQVSTVRDMARILAKAMENEVFCEFFGAVHYNVPATNMSQQRALSTGNYLMNNESVQIYHDTRVTGGRTAVTSTGYHSIATSAENNGMQLICIITGSESVYKDDGYTVEIFGGYNETSLLLNAGFEGFEAKQVIYEGQTVDQYSVDNGTSDVVVGAMDSVYTVLPYEVSSDDLDYRLVRKSDALKAPVEKGQILSALEVWYGSTCVGYTDLCAMNGVPVAQTQSVNNSQNTGSTTLKKVFTVAISAVVAVIVLLIVIRTLNSMRNAAQRNRSRKHRRSRRRSR